MFSVEYKKPVPVPCLCLIAMVLGTNKRRQTVRKRRRGQKGGDIVRSAIGKSLPLLFTLYGKMAGAMYKRVKRAKKV